MPNELSEIALHLAGETGQMGLARTAGAVGTQASLDQHAAEIRDALAGHRGRMTPAMLLEYAQGFVEAAIGRGWRPPHRRESAAPGPPILDWESLRLTAVCRLLGESGLP
ncbi:MAG TPA: DUF6401 family natural product biosynthesis protein [Streptosporangiaceae bacterium]|jgi:hypothetical protein|nr:DUF6401 family natural product biosynthesis protein [Streptosporangiaceae bacterium]